ncbi:uncharacterized protein LOC130655344 isoform X2 [Hydractinia symbiolongicarpus]|uniref:uncharacterized protein LOC130655344 isoform X2 n=1 Tax=Hydractinia symbiolongicarpus TaxID=13093 RepID=UPI00254B4D5B|nr:uncharacterized protein LOC130655344 isoform X2 [Hydractinia symbiolongicarpus]
MGSVDVETIVVNGENVHQKVGARESVNKLHDLVHKLEEENDLPSPKKHENGFSEHFESSNSVSHDENMNNNDRCSLENVGPVQEFEFDTDLDSEDSWLFESPKKFQTPGPSRSPEKWLKDDTSTPELMRVRGSLSAKLEVIAFESRKGQYQKLSNRKDSSEVRRISKQNKFGSMNSVLSLDWDYDEDDELSIGSEHVSLEDVTNHYRPEDDYDSDPEPRAYHDMPPQIASQLLNLSRDRHAWTDPGRKTKADTSIERTFSLDWSDDEELHPMQIDFNKSSQSSARSRIQVAPNPTIVKRGGSGLGVATPRARENYDYDDLVAKPTGGVRPRKGPTRDDTDFRMSSPDDAEFSEHAPVVPRGAKRARQTSHTKHRITFASCDVIIEEDFRAFRAVDVASPRGVGNIAKPVQRRKAPEQAEQVGAVRLRGPGSFNNLKPRGPGGLGKSHSASELQTKSGDASFKVNLPNSGEGAVIRRRGPAPVQDSSPSPRRPKEPSAVARVQGIPQVRRSTGSLPVKSESAARPRRSHSPGSGVPRPRGQVVTQSWQADY